MTPPKKVGLPPKIYVRLPIYESAFVTEPTIKFDVEYVNGEIVEQLVKALEFAAKGFYRDEIVRRSKEALAQYHKE